MEKIPLVAAGILTHLPKIQHELDLEVYGTYSLGSQEYIDTPLYIKLPFDMSTF